MKITKIVGVALVVALASVTVLPAVAQDHSQHTSAPKQDPHAGHDMKSEPHEMSGMASHTNVRVDVPELPILPGADPSVDTIPEGPALAVGDFEQRAVATSPTIARAAAEVEAATGRAKQAGLLPNPTVGYSSDEISSGAPANGGQHGFFVDQTIPLGGKLGKRRDAVLGEVKEAEARLEVARIQVVNAVRLAYYDALAAQKRADLERRMVALLQEAVRTSYGLYNVGQADRPDVLEIEIEARQAQVRLISARVELDRTRQQLALVVSDPELRFGRLEGTLEEAFRGADTLAVNQILERSPEATAARAGIERARLAIRSAKAERYPDLFVTGGARYNREFREVDAIPLDRVGWQGFVEAGVSIPIFNRNQGNISAAEAELRISEAELRRLELGIRSRFTSAMARYRDAARISEAYEKEIIPRAEEAYRLYLERYQEMQAAYPQVLIARRTLLQSNLDYIAALESLYRASIPLRGFLIGQETASMDTQSGGSTSVNVPGSSLH